MTRRLCRALRSALLSPLTSAQDLISPPPLHPLPPAPDVRMMRFVMLALIVLACPVAGWTGEAGQVRSGAEPAIVSRSYETKGWLVQETASFRVFCRADFTGPRRLASACEALR